MSNPLIDPPKAQSEDFKKVPPFGLIKDEHIEPAMKRLVDDYLAKLGAFEKEVESLSGYEAVVGALSDMGEPLSMAWGAASHLNGVRNSDALREAYMASQPLVVDLSIKESQSEAIHAAYKKLADTDLTPGQRRHVDQRILSATLSGIDLEGKEQERFNEIQRELSELSTTFSNRVLDATKAFELIITQKHDVAGLPASYLVRAAASAEGAGHEGATAEAGPWRVGLDYPSFGPFMMHAQARELREKLYRAYVTRASVGELDNTETIDRILSLRSEMAQLLGYESFAELSLARKMAGSVSEIETLLTELCEASLPIAKNELEELRALAKSGIPGAPNDGDIKHWDVGFLSERLKEKKFELKDEELRPYFPLPRVLDGLFALAKRLFAVDIVAADGEAPVWNDDVRFFRVKDESGTTVAGFFLDAYARPENKRGGAWMDECVSRKVSDEGVQVPVAYLTCNQTPPSGDVPSLMTFGEVETLFHEFGHGLQHMLTQQDVEEVAGISGVEWDAVELPSQFMENWCYDEKTLKGMAKHYESGETLPEAFYQKLLAARTFRAGAAMVRQIFFARTDLELHHRYTPGKEKTIWDVNEAMADKTLEWGLFDESRSLCAFSHIFAGGYAAGYYSYKWAEVLSADAFSAFEDAGLDDEAAVQKTGRAFRDTVLAKGGGEHPMRVFESFRGRAPSVKPLLRHSGLA